MLIRDIIADAPQLKNAVDGLETFLDLQATLRILPPPKNFGFVSKLRIGPNIGLGNGTEPPAKEVLSLSDEAAFELYDHLSASGQQRADSEVMLRIDDDDVRSLKSESRRTSIESFLRFRPRTPATFPPSRELVSTLEKIIKSNSAEEAYQEIQALAARKQEEAEAALNAPLRNKIGTFAGEETAIPTYVRNLVERLSELKVVYEREARKPIGRDEAKRLLDLKISRKGPEVHRKIQQAVNALLGVQIDAFQGESLVRGEPVAELDVDNFLVQANGSGIREALRLMLDFELGKPKILLVEEPEVHLHPALETTMMRYLKSISSDCQVFLTTHSTNFLDTADMKNVYLVSKTGSTQVRLLNMEDAEAEIPKELGIRLSSLFMFDRLVFVEGSSDEDVIREWASILGVNLAQANVGFVHMEGVRNYAHFAAEKTLSFLTKRQVKMWFIIDHDEKDDAEIAKITSRLKEQAATRILTKREVENYLVCPRPIREFIKFKNQAGGLNPDSLPTEADIRRTIDESAEKLKQVAIDKRVVKIICQPIYPSPKRLFEDAPNLPIPERVENELGIMVGQLEEARKKAHETLEEQTKLVDAIWNAKKLDIVPGDILLDRVLREYGLRFHKERDSAHLAGLMNAGEIDHEIIEIIREIGT